MDKLCNVIDEGVRPYDETDKQGRKVRAVS
jgi:hypothetical protein